MVKKKEDEVPEVVEAIGDEKALVSVEMTQAEKDEFAAFKVEKEMKEADERNKANEPMFNGDLRFMHQVNGEKFGPGKFKAPYALARDLMNQDTRHYHQRLKEKESDSFMIDIAKRGVGKITRVETCPV